MVPMGQNDDHIKQEDEDPSRTPDAGKRIDLATFWSGLIDDIRIYSYALTEEVTISVVTAGLVQQFHPYFY